MQEHSFKKSLTLFDSTAIVAGSMIGSGIFIVSADIARQVGSPGWLMMVWVITGVLTIFAALSYGELAGMFPNAGGQYVYLKEAYNPLTGFLYGWTLFLVIQTGTIAAVAMAFAKFLGVIVPWISESVTWIQVGMFKFGPVQIVAIGSVAFLTWINTRGIKAGKRIQGSFTSVKVLLLILFILIGLTFAANNGILELNTKIIWDASGIQNGQTVPLAGFALIPAIGMAMVGSLFSSDATTGLHHTGTPGNGYPSDLQTALYLIRSFHCDHG